VEEITHPDDRDATSRNLVQALEGMALPRFEKRYLRKDGETVWGEVSVSLVRDADGTPNYTIGQVLDVTARRQAEEALSASEERYRALFEDAPVGVWEYDCSRLPEHLNQMKQRGITDVRKYLEAHPEEEELCLASLIPLDVNRAAVKLTKAGNRNHLLENMPSVSCDEARAYFRMMVAGLVNGENSFEAESALRTLTGEKREVLVSSLFIPGRDGLFRKAVFATADMTELRAAERELTRQKEAVQLQRMETLAATGRLAAGVAHEINNPLQNIVAQLDLLSEELPVKLRKGKRIRLIRDSVEKMATIVKNLLRLHRSPKEDEAFCAAAAVIRSVTDLIMPQATKRQVRVEVSVMPPDATAPLSTVRLTQILLNLVLNALDATPAGGVIQIELDQAPEETLLVVSDTGSGISPEHRSQIFSPFFTTKGPAGTGLGLPVTHSLVTEAGGTIDLADREGGGTTFFVRFAGGRYRRR
jgi:signal transduction histidine kinase